MNYNNYLKKKFFKKFDDEFESIQNKEFNYMNIKLFLFLESIYIQLCLFVFWRIILI